MTTLEAPLEPGRVRRAIANAGQLVSGRLIGAIAAAVWLVVAARSLQPEAFGRLAVLISVGTVIGVVTEAGLPLLVVDAIGREPSKAHAVVRQTLKARVALTFAGAALLLGIGVTVGEPAAAAWYAVSMIGSAVTSTIGPALRAGGRVVPEAVAESGGRIAVLVVGMALLSVSATPATVAAAYAVGLGGAAAVLLVYSHRLFAVPNDSSVPAWTVPWKRALPLGIAAALVTVYNRIDLWLLALLATSRSAGLYAAMYRFFEGLLLPAAALGALLLPMAVREGPTRRRILARRYGLCSAAIAAAGGLLIVVVAPQLVSHLFGANFLPAVPALRLLAVAAIPSAFLTAVSPLASVLDKRGCTHFILGASLASVVVNVLLIPVWGATGAAFGMVVSQLLLAALFWRQTARLGD